MKNDTKILILYDAYTFQTAQFKRDNICADRTFTNLSFFWRVIRRISRVLFYSDSYWYADWKRCLPYIETVIVFAPTQLKVLQFIKKANNNIKIIVWYWNPIFRLGVPSQEYFEFAELWSFDPKDCKEFGLKLNSTFFFKNILLPKTQIEFDVFFLGFDKGRKKQLQDLQITLSKYKIKSHFHIVPDRRQRGRSKPDFIPYNDYLQKLSKATAIIDINQNGQTGLTLRPMESIFFRKKLITDNITIADQDFYNPNNIFIIGIDDFNHIKDFLESPYVPLREEIVQNYDLENWVGRFNIQ